MRPEDRELLARVSRVNSSAGSIALRVLSGLADDDALGAAFTRRATQLGVRAIEGPAPP